MPSSVLRAAARARRPSSGRARPESRSGKTSSRVLQRGGYPTGIRGSTSLTAHRCHPLLFSAPKRFAMALDSAARAPPHPALAHLTPTPRLLRLPQRDVAEPAPRAPTQLLRPFMAPAATKAAVVPKEAVGWPTSSSPGCGRSTDSSASDDNWQHASWDRTRPASETPETGDAAPERPAPVAVPGFSWQRPPRVSSPAVTPREAGGGTLPRHSPGKSSSARSSAKRSPSKNFGPSATTSQDAMTGRSPRRAAPDRSVLVPFDDPPFRPERTGPQALPEDVLQVARARSNPNPNPNPNPFPA